MSSDDLDWLAAQQPHRIGVECGARERARLALVEHSSPTGKRGFRLGRLVRTRMFGFAAATAAVGIAATVVATVLVLPSTGSDGAAVGAPRLSQSARGGQAAVHHHGTVNSPLTRLAAYVSASAAPVGDATLVARTTTTSDGNSVTVYDLYSDNGQYFFSPTASGLAGEVSAHHDEADGMFAREIAAAKLAAGGDVAKAAHDIAVAPDPSVAISPTVTASDARAAAAKQAAIGQSATLQPGDANPLFDNWVWENSQDALVAGSGDPQVRAGVLRILATLPGVTVTRGTSGGQSTLVLTAGAAEFGDDRTEQMTINADSGVPIQSAGGQTGASPAGTVDYKVSRVALANPLATLASRTVITA